MGVDEVRDERDRQTVIGEGRPQQPRGALVKGPHGVAHVGDQSGPGVGGGRGHLGAAGRMAERHEHAPSAEGGDGVERPGELGGEGEDAHQRAEGVEPPPVELRPDELGTMGPGNRQEGAFEMGPGDLGAPPGRAPRRPVDPGQGSLQGVEGRGDDGRAPRRDALSQQGGVESVPVRAGGAGHVDGADPVDLEVHETRDEHHVGDGRRRGPDLGDQPVLDHDLGVGHRSGG